MSLNVSVQAQASKTAVLLIDIQEFYFPGGAMELVKPDVAAYKAKEVLEYSREKELLVVHVKHKASNGDAIHEFVKPINSELVIEKTEVNAFNGTDLNIKLKERGITNIVVVGMQTHMCVEGAVRGAYDLGYQVVLVEDACATRDLNFYGINVEANMVHLSTLATLKNYAKIIKAEDFLKKFPF